jgi:hypothetical protein
MLSVLYICCMRPCIGDRLKWLYWALQITVRNLSEENKTESAIEV